MYKHLNNWFVGKSSVFRSVLLLGLLPIIGYAQVPSGQGNPAPGGSQSSSAAQELGDILTRIINFGVGLLVILAVAMIVYISFLFLTAGGSSEKFQEARRWLVYVVVAVAAALLSRVFVDIVIQLVGR